MIILPKSAVTLALRPRTFYSTPELTKTEKKEKERERKKKRENVEMLQGLLISILPGEFCLSASLTPFYIILDFASIGSLPVIRHLRFSY